MRSIKFAPGWPWHAVPVRYDSRHLLRFTSMGALFFLNTAIAIFQFANLVLA